MLWTLAMHAHDAESPQPILGDRFAGDLLERVDQPPELGVSLGGNTPLICTRAKLIDDAARAFLARLDEAVVLHLGCGLDSRVLRGDPGPGVRWFDVDQETVIELRRRFYDDRENVEMVAASVTDPGWWSEVPDDRPRHHRPRRGPAHVPRPRRRRHGRRRRAGAGRDPGRRHGRPVGHPDRGLTVTGDARAADTGFLSSTADLAAAASSATRRDEVSLVDATATRTGGVLSTAIRLLPRWFPAGATRWS